jgi:HAD superfamily hydrolase (TIGR01549 family)
MAKGDSLQEAVLFDLEDTLINTPWADSRHVVEFRRATRSKLIELGIPKGLLAGIERATLMRNKAEDYIDAKFSRSRRAKFNEEMEKFLGEYEMDSVKRSTLFPDTVPVLKTLRKCEAKIGLVTNTSRRAVDWVFQNENLGAFFDCTATREDVKKLKPDPEGIKTALKILRTRSFLMIGDLILDVVAAKKAGGIAVLVKREKDQNHPSEPVHNIDNDSSEKADYGIKSLQEVPKIIRNQEGIMRL